MRACPGSLMILAASWGSASWDPFNGGEFNDKATSATFCSHFHSWTFEIPNQSVCSPTYTCRHSIWLFGDMLNLLPIPRHIVRELYKDSLQKYTAMNSGTGIDRGKQIHSKYLQLYPTTECFQEIQIYCESHLRFVKSISDAGKLNVLNYAFQLRRGTGNYVLYSSRSITFKFTYNYILSGNKNTYVRILCIDYSSAFNTGIPNKLISTLLDLGFGASICHWLLEFPTSRPVG